MMMGMMGPRCKVSCVARRLLLTLLNYNVVVLKPQARWGN